MESVGGGVLSATTDQGLPASHGGAGAGLQVAAGDLAVLAGPQPYEEKIYEAALRKSGSPVVALFDRVELGKSPWKNPVRKN